MYLNIWLTLRSYHARSFQSSLSHESRKLNLTMNGIHYSKYELQKFDRMQIYQHYFFHGSKVRKILASEQFLLLTRRMHFGHWSFLTIIDFFFCLKRSLQRNTTAVLNTKHIACNSRPFLIFPKKSEIFNHSTPP